jgi:alpha-tubulin suppressor-like RCC1 family protein
MLATTRQTLSVSLWAIAFLSLGAAPAAAQARLVDPSVKQIDVGERHSCAVTEDGGVLCWGDNAHGALGDGTTTERSGPVRVFGLESGIASVSAGGTHTCALTTTGGVKCWGSNGSGRLGNGGVGLAQYTASDVTGLASGVTAVAAGGFHTCAVTNAGGVKCWGDNRYHQLGDGTAVSRTTPVDVVGLTGVTSISAGRVHTCAVTAVGGVKCWGYNADGELGDGTWVNWFTPVNVLGLDQGVSGVAAGLFHTCAVTSAGGMKCWGYNLNGQLGDGTTRPSLVPKNVLGLSSGVASITTGDVHTCALSATGAATCWGWNGYGQVGDGTASTRLIPVGVAGLGKGVVSVSAGAEHSCALSVEGGVMCWGSNTQGQTGTRNSEPTAVDGRGLSAGITQVSTGANHSCAVTGGGGAACWGDNREGQLGTEISTPRGAPTQVAGLTSGISRLSAGYSHTCAVTTSGEVKCWGGNSEGQLGDGTTNVNQRLPVAVRGLPAGVVSVSTGIWHTCALTGAGGVKCWGNNTYGQLGDGTTTNRRAPTDVVGMTTGVARLSTHGWHTCAVKTDSGVYCWGSNYWGQLGDGTRLDRSVPVAVSGLTSGAAMVSAAYSHTCAVTVSGGARCWGSNDVGQLGDGTTTERVTPVEPIGLDGGVTGLAVGTKFTCATTRDGVRCWGSNSHGQLGDGTRENRSSPTRATSVPQDTAGIAAGQWHTCVWTSLGAVKCVGENYFGQLGNGVSGFQPTPIGVGGLNSAVIHIDDASIVEGGRDLSLLAVTLSLPRAASNAIEVDYVTRDGTARSNSDFVASSGVFTIPAAATSKQLVIPVKGDLESEPSEAFTITFTSASGIRVSSSAMIVDDDPPTAALPRTQYRLYLEATKEHLYTTDFNEYTVLPSRGWIQEGAAYRLLTNGLYNGVATIPLFRVYHPGIQQHHWTTDANEAMVLGRTSAWHFEGTVGYLLPTHEPGSVPLYRLALASPPLHLWTTDRNEYDTLALRGWVREGIIGFVLP